MQSAAAAANLVLLLLAVQEACCTQTCLPCSAKLTRAARLLCARRLVLQAEELEWGTPECAAIVRRLASLKPELVLAADCCYVDQDGQSPSTPAFVEACRGEAERAA